MHYLLTPFAALALLLPVIGSAEDLRFPEDAVTDVTKAPYFAKGDGKNDDTKALQNALDDRKSRLIYLPEGTYAISGQLRWSKGTAPKILQGQSRDGVTIRLMDESEGFDDPANPRGLIWTGPASTKRYRNAVRNLTIDTGKRNPGAIGLQFVANNHGTVDSVRIRCGDTGPIGLDLGTTEKLGPCLIRDLEVIGFDTGIACRGENSVTFDQVRLDDQRVVGFRNEGPCAFIQGLRSKGAVPVLQNAGAESLVVILDSKLEGTGGAAETAGITNQTKAAILVRRIETSGFACALKNSSGHEQTPDGAALPEWFSHPHVALFPSPERTLNLPVKAPPLVAFDAPHDWANAAELKSDKAEPVKAKRKRARIQDWAAQIQQTMDSGKPTVYFPEGGIGLTGTIRVPATVRRLIGCEQTWGKASNGTIVIEDGAEPLILERFDWSQTSLTIQVLGNRPVIVRNIMGGAWEIASNTGDVFFEDVAPEKITLKPFANVWARQLSLSGTGEPKVINDGGNLWILGLKAEGEATQIESLNGARTEVLGAVVDAKSTEAERPCWSVRDSAFSVTMGEIGTRRSFFRVLVEETRSGETRMLRHGEVPERAGGSLLTLFSAFPEN